MIRLLMISLLGLATAVTATAQDTAPAKDSFDSLIAAMVKSLGEIGETLGKVTDEKTAKEATPKLEQSAKTMAELTERAKKLGNPTADEEKALKGKYEANLTAVNKKLQTEVQRLAGQPFGKGALDALKAKPKSSPEKPKEPAKSAPEKPTDK